MWTDAPCVMLTLVSVLYKSNCSLANLPMLIPEEAEGSCILAFSRHVFISFRYTSSQR